MAGHFSGPFNPSRTGVLQLKPDTIVRVGRETRPVHPRMKLSGRYIRRRNRVKGRVGSFYYYYYFSSITGGTKLRIAAVCVRYNTLHVDDVRPELRVPNRCYVHGTSRDE